MSHPTSSGHVLVVGPDGAGKTTVVDHLEELVGGCAIRDHYRPGIVLGRDGDAAPVTEPHNARPRTFAMSVLKLMVVFLDSLLGSLIRWGPASKAGVVVVERGWFDMAVDPRRYRLHHSLVPVARRLGRLLPRADLAVILAGAPGDLHRRKPEIGTAEVARQSASWRELAPRAAKQVIEIDTVSTAPQEAAQRIRDALTGPGGGRWRSVPLTPQRLDLRATAPEAVGVLYRSHKRWGRSVSRLHPVLFRSPLARPVPAPPGADVLAPFDAAVAMRSSVEARWVLGVLEDDSLRAVAKVGPVEDEGLRNEADVLGRLRPPPLYLAPYVQRAEAVSDRFVLVTGPLPRPRRDATLEEIVDLTTSFIDGSWGSSLVHGDVAPWNVARTEAGLTVWDWEDARLDERLPLHDLTHYVIRTGALLQRWSPEEAARLLTRDESVGLRHLRELEESEPPASLVRAYLDRTEPGDEKEAAFREALAAALG